MLLDTNVLIWLLTQPDRLGAQTKRILNYTEDLYISIVSQYEIAIKERLGKFKLLQRTKKEIATQSITVIPLDFNQFQVHSNLKHIQHRDPFDLMIIATAMQSNLTLITSDKKILTMKHHGLKTQSAGR